MVAVILDFDSTITEASTLMQIYLRLPEEIFKQAAVISEKNYYNKELPLTKKCYTQIKNIINNEEEWEKCLKYITAEDKIRAYKKIQKPEVLYAGDSLPDLLPILNASKGFAFISHDKDFIEVCNKIKEKFSKEIFLVQNFQEVNNIIK